MRDLSFTNSRKIVSPRQRDVPHVHGELSGDGGGLINTFSSKGKRLVNINSTDGNSGAVVMVAMAWVLWADDANLEMGGECRIIPKYTKTAALLSCGHLGNPR
jgi:hypothetical protein